MFTVYVLYSHTCKKHYVGQTNDLQRRLNEHNNPQHNPKKFTSRNPGPWSLIRSEEFTSRSDAMNRERWLKSGRGRQWINEKFGRASPPQDAH